MNFMKRIQTIAAFLVVFALAGMGSLKAAEPGTIQGKAIVRSVTGNATYTANGVTLPLKPNMQLDPGATIRTGPESVVYLSVNGLTSAVRVQADTTLVIPQMDRIGAAREGDTQTQLELKLGTILGQVQKISANSTYEIKTPHGVAGIRGTDYGIVVTQEANGQYVVTFTSISGLVIVSAVVDNNVQTRNLHDGESWTPGSGDVHPTPLDMLNEWKADLGQMNIPTLPPPSVPILQPFPTGGTPTGVPSGQQPSSPNSVVTGAAN